MRSRRRRGRRMRRGRMSRWRGRRRRARTRRRTTKRTRRRRRSSSRRRKRRRRRIKRRRVHIGRVFVLNTPLARLPNELHEKVHAVEVRILPLQQRVHRSCDVLRFAGLEDQPVALVGEGH
jgi:hypothetical protein